MNLDKLKKQLDELRFSDGPYVNGLKTQNVVSELISYIQDLENRIDYLEKKNNKTQYQSVKPNMKILDD